MASPPTTKNFEALPTPPQSQSLMRTRQVALGNWRTFIAVAQHLNFRAAAESLSLTQSAISRQIQSLEDEIGVPLFLRHTRAVELTIGGAQLLRAITPSVERIDSAVRQVRQTAGRKSVSVTTFASFASMWLIPRMEAFQRDNPDIDIRIDASDARVDLDIAEIDLALRYCVPGAQARDGQRLFGEQLAVVCSPWLLKDQAPLRTPADIARFTLIEADFGHRSHHIEILTWQRWFSDHQHPHVQPKRWLYFSYAHQMVQAALSGQGLALARMPLIADALAAGDLVEAMPGFRLESPLAYWMIPSPRSVVRPEVTAFCDWLHTQAERTRLDIGDVPDPDTIDNLD